jgi:small subunit ribosomal protein S20
LAAKSKLRSQIRKVREAVAAGDAQAAASELKNASKALAKASTKGLLHSRTASRRTGRLARSVAKLSS